MFRLDEGLKVYLHRAPVDFRLNINGLAALVQTALGLDPFASCVYVFSKLLDAAKKNGREKYQLSQADFYQLYAYGQHYLDGTGDIVLIYPKTDAFTEPLPVFDFPKAIGMRLWVLPFCLKERRLKLPASPQLRSVFVGESSNQSQAEDLNAVPA